MDNICIKKGKQEQEYEYGEVVLGASLDTTTIVYVQSWVSALNMSLILRQYTSQRQQQDPQKHIYPNTLIFNENDTTPQEVNPKIMVVERYPNTKGVVKDEFHILMHPRGCILSHKTGTLLIWCTTQGFSLYCGKLQIQKELNITVK